MRFVKEVGQRGRRKKKCYLTCLKLRGRQDKIVNPEDIRFSFKQRRYDRSKNLISKKYEHSIYIYPQRESSSRWYVCSLTF